MNRRLMRLWPALCLVLFVGMEDVQAREKMLSVSECKEALSAPTTDDLAEIAYSNCIDAFSDRSDIAKTMLYVANTYCSARRVRDIGKAAENLYKAGKKHNEGDVGYSEVENRARQLRRHYRGKSKMYRKCWRTKRSLINTGPSWSLRDDF